MIRLLLRTLWRVFVFCLGVVGLWFITFKIVPYANQFLPLFIVLFLLYCFVAYIFIPSIIRTFQLVIKPLHVPLYATTSDALPADPVNIAIIVKDKAKFIASMEKAGWTLEDPHVLKSYLHSLYAMLFNKRYPAAPMSNLYLFGRQHDLGFQAPNNENGSPRSRHHVRFWRLEEPLLAHKDNGHYSFWMTKFHKLFHPDREIWVGAATEDISPIAFSWRTGKVLHGISDDADSERDYVLQTLKDAKCLARTSKTQPGDELTFRSQSFRVRFTTDGSLVVGHVK